MEDLPELCLAGDDQQWLVVDTPAVVKEEDEAEDEEVTTDLTNREAFAWPVVRFTWRDFLPGEVAKVYLVVNQPLPSLLEVVDGNHKPDGHSTSPSLPPDVSESLPNGGSEFWFNYVFSWWFTGKFRMLLRLQRLSSLL